MLADRAFRKKVDGLVQARRKAAESPAWFQKNHSKSPLTAVTYFCMEFMLSEALPIYSGGLGNVAGDQLKAASDLGVPVIGIGLLYQQGYFRQVIDKDGAQQALFPYNDPWQLPITPLRRPNGEWVRLEILLPGYSVWLRSWQVQVGRVKLYLLDSNDAANYPAHRGITSELYGGGQELRLKQEILLGIGGWRLLNVLGIRPEVCHLNEGHAAFAVLERARTFMEDTGQSFEVALTVTRAGNLFTTHTPVEAGFDRFAPALIDQYLGWYAQNKLGIPLHDLLALGRQDPNNTAEPFNMAYLTVRGSGAVNGVSRLHGQVKPSVEKAINEFATRGFRSLGVARAEGEGGWQFVGVLPLFDPPWEDARATIATARQMGVKIKMVTGDALAIAKETASKLDMGANILDAAGLGDAKKQETKEVAESIEKADGFAQVFPEHKFHIVDVLQKLGHIVGMTGDGVNDAPALKKADCGIAVSGATDAARAAADIVLMSPGLTVIIDAIKESRRIFQRMNSYAIYRIAETIRVLIFMTLAILIFNFYPLTAVMIVMLALLNDGAILSIAYDNVHYKDQPEAWNMPMVLGISTVLGIIGVLSAFGLFYLGERVFHLDRAHIQTLMYLKLSVAGHLTIFLTRTRGPFWSIRPAKILWVAVVGTQIVATLIAVYGLFMTPLGWGWALFVWGYALVWFLINDRVKLLTYRIVDPTKAGIPTNLKP